MSSAKQSALPSPAAELAGFTYCLNSGWKEATCRKPAACLPGPGLQVNAECKPNFFSSSVDISWQSGIEYSDYYFFPWLNMSAWVLQTGRMAQASAARAAPNPQISFQQQLSLHSNSCELNPCVWERMHGTEVCNAWMVWSNSWSHACGIANMRVKNCLKGFQVKHSSTFCFLWNTAGWKLLTVWSIRQWNSFPREVLEGLSFESFSAEENIL